MKVHNIKYVKYVYVPIQSGNLATQIGSNVQQVIIEGTGLPVLLKPRIGNTKISFLLDRNSSRQSQ